MAPNPTADPKDRWHHLKIATLARDFRDAHRAVRAAIAEREASDLTPLLRRIDETRDALFAAIDDYESAPKCPIDTLSS